MQNKNKERAGWLGYDGFGARIEWEPQKEEGGGPAEDDGSLPVLTAICLWK